MIPEHAVSGRVDGPAIVLSSSIGTTMDMWRPQLAALEERFTVVRYDHRGHGGSPAPRGPYRLDDLGGDVLDLLDQLDLDQVGFAGLSLGGMTGMWLAAHAPERVGRLALICTSAKTGTPEHWHERASAVLADGCAVVADTATQRWFTQEFRDHSPEVVQQYADMLTATPATGYAACCAAIGAMDLRADLSRIAAPTLVIAAEEDPATPPEHARLIAEAVPAARLEIVPGAAHLANVEQPDTVTNLLVTHFSRNGDTR